MAYNFIPARGNNKKKQEESATGSSLSNYRLTPARDTTVAPPRQKQQETKPASTGRNWNRDLFSLVDGYSQGVRTAREYGRYDGNAWDNQYKQIHEFLDSNKNNIDDVYYRKLVQKLDVSRKGATSLPAYGGTIDRSKPAFGQPASNNRADVLRFVNQATGASTPQTVQNTRNMQLAKNTYDYLAGGGSMDNLSYADLKDYQQMAPKVSAFYDRLNNEWNARSRGNEQTVGNLQLTADEAQRNAEAQIRKRNNYPDYWSFDNFTDEEKQEVNDARAAAENGYTQEPKTMPAEWAMTGNINTANDMIGRELENRDFQKKYAQLTYNDDFAENSRYQRKFLDQQDVVLGGQDARKNAELLTSLYNDDSHMKKYNDIYYEAVNGNQDAMYFLRNVKNQNTGEVNYSADSFVEEYMNDYEREIFNYTFATQGADAAKEYVDGIRYDLTKRAFYAADEEFRERLKNADLVSLGLANLASVPLNLAQGAANFLGQSAEMIMGRQVNPYSYENTAGTIRDETEQKIVSAVESAGGGDFAKTLASMGYNAFMSGLDSSLSLALGSGVAETLGLAGGVADSVTKYVSLGLMSSGAASNTLNNELMMGIPQGRAALDSMTAGLIEFATEQIGMDNLFNNIINGRGNFVSYMKQVLAEGAEELVGDVATDAINQLYDIIGNTSYSELNRQANAYWLENGMAPSQRNEAMAHVLLDRLQEYAVDTMVGSLSVITGEGSVGAIANFNNAKALTSHLDASTAQDVIQEGLTLDPNSRAYKGAMALQERMMNEFNPVAITPKEVQRLARDIVYEVQGIENDTDRQQAEQDMFKAFGIDRFLHPDVQTTSEQPRTTNDPNAGEFEVNMAEDDAVKAAQDAEQKRIDDSTINSIINEATSNNTTVNPDEIARRVHNVTEHDSADDLSDILTPEQMQTVAEIASRNSAAQAVQNAMDSIAEKSVPVRQEEAAEETVQETVEEEPVTEQEQPPIEVDTSGFANTLTPAARKVYEQTLEEARQNGMNAADATQAFLEVYTAGTHKLPYAPSQNNRRLSGATRAMISQTAHRESTEYTTNLEQKGFAKSAAAGTQVQTSKGLVATPVLARAVQDGRISQRTADVMNKLGQMLGVRINVLSTNPTYNGEYKAQKADINLYLDAKFFNSKTTDEAVIGVLGHELSHRLEDISPEAYRQLTTMVMQTIGSSGFARMVEHNMRLAPGMTILDAQGEVVSDFVGTMLFRDDNFADRFIGNVQVQTAEQRTALQGLRDFVHKVIDWIRGNKDAFKEPEKTITWMEKLENTLTNLIEQSAAAVGESGNIVEAENIEYLPAGEHTETVQTPAEEVQYSLKYKDEVFDAVAKYNLEHGFIDEHTLAAAKETMDEVAEALNDPKVQELIPEENRLARVDRDEKGKLYTTLYGNASYGYTGENTTVCPRSLAMENLLDLVSQKLGHSLTVKEGMAVSQLAWAYTAQPTCQYCYVWADRLAQREARNTYLQMRDNVLKAVGTLGPNDKVVTQAALTTPTTKNGKNTNTVFILDDAIAKHPEFEKQLRAYDEFLAGRKNTKQQKRRFVQWLTLAKDGADMVTQAQAATDVSMAQAVMDNPDLQEQMKDLYDYSLKASHAKLKVGYVAYNNDILKLSDKVIEMMNKNYGIRFYSYSDYHPAFILENMQMFTDAAAMGLKGLAYTKDLDFVRIFAGTGCNINISIKAIDGTTEMDAMQGADWEEAKKLRNKKGNENVGIILVATSDEQVEWALDQDWIDVVIPYHVVFSDKVGQIYGWKNYKAFQADKKLKGWDASKDVKEITPPMHQNNRQLYFDLCDQYHLEPRFKQWRNHPGYMKLVNETRQAEGMTQPMQPVFNLDAAKDSLAKLVKDGGYDNPYATRNQETIRELAEEFAPIVEGASVEKLEQIARGEIRASRKDADYMAAVNRGDMDTAQRMVDEAARNAGYDSPKLYHGTDAFGFTTVDNNAPGADGFSFWAANREDTSASYTQYGKVRRINSEISEEEEDEYREKISKKVDDALYDFRRLIDRTFSEWYFGQGPDGLREEFDSANPQAGYGDGIYDIFETIIADAFRQYSDELDIEEDYDEWIDNSEEGKALMEAVLDLEGLRSQVDEIEYGIKGGIYELYANTDNMYVYEGNGELWNNLRPADLPMLPFNAPYKTRDVAVWARKNGYSGVLFKNIKDNGKYGRTGNTDVYAFFSPTTQVKSADPITYDDAGNVIPLSERFNTENPDIRYSTRDTRWLDGLIIDDIIAEIQKNLDAAENKKAQRRVDEVNKRLKQIGLQFTGTKEAAWTDERIDMYLGGGWYGADGIPNYAQAHIAYMTPQQYLNLTMGTNTATVDRIENETAEYGEVDFNKLGDSAPIRLYIDKGRNGARVTGHEGRHRMMMLGRAGFSRVPVLLFDSSDKYEKTILTNYTLRPQTFGSDKLISRGRNVTLDEMIPFSQGNRDLIKEKFGSGNVNADVRYSRRDTEASDDFRSIVERNQQREQTRVVLDAASSWRNKVTKLDTRKLRAGTEAILNDFSDTLTKDQQNQIVHEVNKLANDIIQNKKLGYMEIEDRATEIASDIVFKGAGVDDVTARNNMLNNAAAEEAIDYLTNLLMANIVTTQTAETSKAIREVQRQIQLNDKLKDTLREVRAKRDQKIREDIDRRKAQREKRRDSKERTYLLKVMNRLEGLAKKSSAEQAEEIRNIIGEFDLTCKGLTEGKAAKLEELKEWVDQRMQEDPLGFAPNPNVLKAIEGLSQKHIANLTIDEVRNITRALLNIEHEIREGKYLAGVADRRDTNTLGREVIEGVNNSRDKAIKHTKGIDGLYNEVVRPETFFRRLVGFDDNNPLYQLTFGDEMSLSTGQRAMIDYNRRAHEKYFRQYLDDKAFQKSIIGKNARAVEIRGIDENGNMVKLKVTPDLLMAIYMHGQNDQNLKHFVDMENRVMKDGRWTTEIQKAGGMTVPDFELYKAGKIEEAYRKGTKITMKRADVRHIASQLTPKEMGYVHAAQRYYSEMSQPEINRVSEILNGYSLANVDNYFRINTDKAYIKADSEAIKFDAKIESQGWTNERMNASNPIMLYSLTDQLQRDIDGHSKYVGLAIPIRNFDKVRGVNQYTYNDDGSVKTAYASSVVKAIDKMYGKKALDYINKLMADIQMPQNNQDFFGKLLAKVRGHYAGAVLTLNLGVSIKQSASYPTAAAEIGWLPLVKALGNFSAIKANRLNMDLVYKYSPLMRLRTEGISTQELGEMKEQGRSIPKLLNWIQGMDVATVKKLWKASEYYVRANFKNLQVGSDAYYKKVGDVHTAVITKTQPNYTALQRPQILRTSNELVRTLNMFKTQPFQNLNILMESFGELKAAQRAYKINGTQENKARLTTARKRAGWAVSSHVVSNLIFAAMSFAAAFIMRRDDKYRDEEDELAAGTVFRKILIDMLGSDFGMMPFGSAIFETVETATDKIAKEINPDAEPIFDAVFYGIDAGTATDSINDSLKGIVNLLSNGVSLTRDLISKAQNDEFDLDWESYTRDAVNDVMDVLMFAGVPAENGKKTATAIAGWILQKIMGRNTAKYWTTRIVDGVKTTNKTALIKNLINTKDKEEYEQLYNTMINEPDFAPNTKDSQKYIDEKIRTWEKSQTANGMTFEDQSLYDDITEELHASTAYKNAKAADQATMDKFAEDLVLKTAKAWENARTAIDNDIFTATEYLTFMVELEKANQANTEGSKDAYSKDEQGAAIKAMGWTDEQAKKYWQYLPKGDTKNPFDPGTKTEKPEITKPSASRPQTPEPESQPEPETEETKPKHNFVSATEGPKKQSDKKKTAPQEGTLSSSLLGGYYYNNGTLQLQVNGAWYTYNNVPEEVFQGLLDAPSAGSYFSYNIKGKY